MRLPFSVIALLGLLSLLSSYSAAACADGTHPQHHQPDTHPPHAHQHSRADSHAPIGVMGDHLHHAGEIMLSYRYMWMDMDGSRNGSQRVSDQEVLNDFMVTPTQMTMQMHMLGAMYAPNDDLTWMLMVPYVSKGMDHVTRMGGTFTTEASGLGDISLMALVRFRKSTVHDSHFNIGLSFPTGDIDAKDQTPMGRSTLPFPMQIGSGTYDLKLGFTHMALFDRWSYGEQINLVKRLGDNDRGYQLGDTLNLTVWGAYNWSSAFSTSVRLNYNDWDDVDVDNAPAMVPVPTARADLRAGRRLDLALGSNSVLGHGYRLAAEVAAPIYQHLDGPQLETDWVATIGLQKAFK